MKMKSLLPFGAGLLVFIGILFCQAQAYAAPPVIRFSSGQPENHYHTRQYLEWGRLIEQNSGGQLKVQVYHSAQLYRDNEVAKAVQMGALESGAVLTMYLSNQLVPASKVFQLPFLLETLDEAMKVHRSDIGMGWKKTAEQKGMKLLAIICYPSPPDTVLLSTKPVKNIPDLKGMVIRAVSPEAAAALKKWGAGPSFLAGSETYLGLQRGTINGSVTSITNYVERKLYEVAPHAIFLPMMTVHTYVAMNKKFFDGLPANQQKAIVDASEAIEARTAQIALKALKEDTDEARRKATLYTPTTAEMNLWKAGMQNIWEDVAKTDKDVSDGLKKIRAMFNR
jgi:C4-dicarboxylate-binding protein DctP